MVETLLVALAGSFVLIAVGLIFFLVKLVQNQRSLPNRKRSPTVRSSTTASTTATVSPKLRRRLINLLTGDSAAADRLVEMVRIKYPGKTENWYWEKAIYDLERDRHN